MFRQLKLTCRGMFHCTFSNNWPKLATLADNGAGTKEHKTQRTKGVKKHQLPKAARTVSLLVYQRVINNFAAQFRSSVRYDILSFHDTRRCFPSARVRRRELLFL